MHTINKDNSKGDRYPLWGILDKVGNILDFTLPKTLTHLYYEYK